jgi:demethylmenaquinone methyltransferase/2-methoxy-6-polyprenyl-1,4-benzoquinol methylase
VHFEQADLFAWAPTRTYDGVFFGFFLSHVPRRELSRFFALVASALAPGGRFGFVDSLRDQCSTAHDHVLPEVDDEIMTRRLDDGREFQIVKNFFEPDELREVAATVGLELRASSTERYFLYGSGERH